MNSTQSTLIFGVWIDEIRYTPGRHVAESTEGHVFVAEVGSAGLKTLKATRSPDNTPWGLGTAVTPLTPLPAKLPLDTDGGGQ